MSLGEPFVRFAEILENLVNLDKPVGEIYMIHRGCVSVQYGIPIKTAPVYERGVSTEAILKRAPQ